MFFRHINQRVENVAVEAAQAPFGRINTGRAIGTLTKSFALASPAKNLPTARAFVGLVRVLEQSKASDAALLLVT